MDTNTNGAGSVEQKSGKGGIIAGIIAAGLVIAGGAYAFLKNSKAPDSQVVAVPVNTTGTNTETNASNTPAIVNSKYKDGTYTAVGDYQSPEGAESIHVTLVIKNDIITDATVTSDAFRRESKEYQAKFIGGFKQYVVGKNISDVNVTKVSGSSLTPKGFMDALAKIKAEAAA